MRWAFLRNLAKEGRKEPTDHEKDDFGRAQTNDELGLAKGREGMGNKRPNERGKRPRVSECDRGGSHESPEQLEVVRIGDGSDFELDLTLRFPPHILNLTPLILTSLAPATIH